MPKKAGATWEFADADGIAPIADLEGLRIRLRKLRDPTNSSAELIHPSGDHLTIVVCGAFASLQHARAGHDPPYLCASVDIAPDLRELESIEFLVFGASTEVAVEHCIPIATMWGVVEHYYVNGELGNQVRWEEI